MPASLIKGESEDEMREFAQSVAAYAKPATGARTPRNGAFDNRGAHDADEAKRRLAKQGIIPAHAGSTLFALIGPPTERDHPRACGEHSMHPFHFYVNDEAAAAIMERYNYEWKK